MTDAGVHEDYSVDWRARMPAVKNQGQCGSCWAFSAVDVVDFWSGSSHSEQQVLDCSPGSNQCGGGNLHSALNYLAATGSDAESAYPYHARAGTCEQAQKTPATSVLNVQRSETGGEAHIGDEIKSGVVSVCITGGDAYPAFSTTAVASSPGVAAAPRTAAPRNSPEQAVR